MFVLVSLLTSLAPGLPGPVDGDLHALGVDGHLGRARAHRDRQVEALPWKHKACSTLGHGTNGSVATEKGSVTLYSTMHGSLEHAPQGWN